MSRVTPLLRATLFFATVITMSPANAAAAVIISSAPVTVRVYGTANLPPAVTNRGLAGAATTIAAADIDIEWKFCDRPAESDRTSCSRPLASRELVLRFLPYGNDPARGAQRPLGDALIDRRTGRGALATIYLDRVHWLAQEAETDVATLLGRAVAHEVTHLLLGSSRHDRHGLMRAVWSCKDLRPSVGGDWSLSARQRSELYAAAIRRASAG
jgi:hypothetical protein